MRFGGSGVGVEGAPDGPWSIDGGTKARAMGVGSGSGDARGFFILADLALGLGLGFFVCLGFFLGGAGVGGGAGAGGGGVVGAGGVGVATGGETTAGAMSFKSTSIRNCRGRSLESLPPAQAARPRWKNKDNARAPAKRPRLSPSYILCMLIPMMPLPRPSSIRVYHPRPES